MVKNQTTRYPDPETYLAVDASSLVDIAVPGVVDAAVVAAIPALLVFAAPAIIPVFDGSKAVVYAAAAALASSY